MNSAAFGTRNYVQPKLSDMKPVMAEAGGRKARPYLNFPTCSVGAGFIPACGESTPAVASVLESFSLN
jgi:hypothetical protein